MCICASILRCNHYFLLLNTLVKINVETYAELRDWSVDHYDQFWGKFFHYSDIKYSKPYDEVQYVFTVTSSS